MAHLPPFLNLVTRVFLIDDSDLLATDKIAIDKIVARANAHILANEEVEKKRIAAEEKKKNDNDNIHPIHTGYYTAKKWQSLSFKL